MAAFQTGTINVADRVGAFAGLTELPAYDLPDEAEDMFNTLLKAGATTGNVFKAEGYALLIAVEGEKFSIVTSPILAD